MNMATDFSAAIFFVCVYSSIRLIGIYHFLFQRQPNSSPPLGYKVKTLFSSIIAMVLSVKELILSIEINICLLDRMYNSNIFSIAVS